MNKTSFLSVYGPAWTEGVSKAHILKSFKKTGVYPFNAAAIQPEQMAPSFKHSTQGNLPLPVPSPVKHLMHFHNQLMTGHYQNDGSHSQINDSQDTEMYLGGRCKHVNP